MNLSLLNSISMQNQLVNKRIDNSLSNLSSGLKINKASDDASGLAIADKLRTHASGIKQAIDNANSAIALLQITDKSMAEISNILDTVKQKLIQAHTNTTSDEGRKTIKKDIEKLLTQIDSISKQTNYNGLTLLSHTGLDFQVGDNGSDIIHLKDIYTTLDGLSGVKLVDDSNNKNPDEELIRYSNRNIYTALNPFVSEDMTISSDAYSITTPDLVISDTEPLSTNKNDILSNSIYVSSNGLSSCVIDVDIEINSNNFEYLGDQVSFNINKFSNIGMNTGTYIFTDDETTKEYFEAYFIAIGRLVPIHEDPIKFYNGDTLYIDFKGGGYNATYEVLSYDENVHYDANILKENINLKFKSVDYSSTGYFSLENVFVNKLEPLMVKSNNSNPLNYGFSQITLPDIATVDVNSNWIIDANNLTVNEENNGQKTCGTLKDLKDMAVDNFSFECAGKFQIEVDNALTILNEYRTEVGSTQNQVESTIRTLMTDYVNTKNAESVIRDVDYSEESANFTKLNIISQAGSFAQSKNIEVQNRILNLLK